MRNLASRRFEGVFQRKEGGAWYFLAEIGRDAATGRRKQLMRGGFKTGKAAATARRKVLASVDEGNWQEPSKETLKAFLESWLEATRPAGPKGLAAWRGDAYNVRSYLLPRLGGTPIQKLRGEKIDQFLAETRANGRVNGRKPLSARTVRGIRVTLGKALSYGVRKGKLVQNAVTLSEPIAQERPHHNVWEASTLRQFLELVREDRLFPLYHLEASTGLRRSEIIALPWASVDLDKGRISINQTMVREESYRVRLVELTKRDSSRRQIALDPETVAVLKSWKAHQAEEQLFFGPTWRNDSNLVFTREDGSFIHPETLSDWFDGLVKKSGLLRITFHELRHTYATLALQARVPVKVVSQRLGHSSITVTYDLYAHVIPGDDESAAAVFAEKVLGNGRR